MMRGSRARYLAVAIGLGVAGVLMPLCARAETCIGDCGGNGSVSTTEVSQGVEIALGRSPISTCTAYGDDVTIDKLILSVILLIAGGCAAETATPTIDVPAPPTATTTQTPTPTATPLPTATHTPFVAPSYFCDLPGSVRTTGPGVVVVPGGPTGTPDLKFMQLPIGFCAHYFARVGNTRQLRFAPGGDVFVTSPTGFTTGGGSEGLNAIVILPDDNRDGTADSQIIYKGDLRLTQGILFTGDNLYYQDGSKILRTPFAPGDRAPTGASELMAEITHYRSSLHWPKALDVADDGTIYVTNGGDQTERCEPSHPFRGGVLALDGSPGAKQIAKGFRNAISVRCARGQGICFAVELARDYTAGQGGREKLVPVREGDDWGFPCCATRDTPYEDIRPIPDCSGVAEENATFLIGDTPFDLDFEPGRWPQPWTNRAFVPLHGAYGLWEGARLIAIERDAMTGYSLPGSTMSGMSVGSFLDFATGWGDGKRLHGRPSTVSFAPDGRLFLGNDNDGNIVWIAPLDLPM